MEWPSFSNYWLSDLLFSLVTEVLVRIPPKRKSIINLPYSISLRKVLSSRLVTNWQGLYLSVQLYIDQTSEVHSVKITEEDLSFFLSVREKPTNSRKRPM